MTLRKPTLLLLVFALALSALLVGVVSAGASVPAGNTGWSWSNPLPAGNTIERVAVSGGRIWAGGATGMLLHSDDGGAGWDGVRTGILDDIRTIDAISPTSVVFAGRCALRRSDDSGITVRRLAWGSNDDSCTAQIQAVSFVTPLRGFLLLSNGDVYLTDDGGDTWRKRGVIPGSSALGGSDSVRDIAFTGASTGVVSVGNRILFTGDAGVQWTPVATGSGGAGLFNFEFSGTTGYAAGDHSELLKTTDGGESWSAVVGDDALRAQAVTSLSCATELVCVASIAASGSILRTEDGGKHWRAAVAAARRVSGVAFVGSTRAIAVGEGGLLVLSDDAGATWRAIGGSVNGAFRGVSVSSKLAATVYGDAGAAARTLDGGKSWASLTIPTSSTLLDVMAGGTNRLYALTADGKLLRSYDSGVNWQSPLAPVNRPRALIVWSKLRVGLVGPRGVSVSNHSGAKGRRVRGPVARMALTSADRAGKATFVYGKSAIAVTLDKGKQWARVARPRGSGAIVKLEMLDARRGYLLDSKAELFQTTSGGKRWRRLETTGANFAVSMAFGDFKHGYLTDNTGRILATNDGGATWSRQYPFYDATGSSSVGVAALGARSAINLVIGSNRIFTTESSGQVGRPSVLTIRPSATRVRKGAVIRITGKLTPATGIEQVAVLARVVGAKGGTKWVSQTRPVSPTGTFTSPWRITADTEFIARWSGDFQHDGDAAPIKIVKLRR